MYISGKQLAMKTNLWLNPYKKTQHITFKPWDREIEKKLISQGQHIVKQPSLAQRGGCLPTDLISLAALINGTLVTLRMFTYLALLISCIFCILHYLFFTIYCILATLSLLIHIFYTYIFSSHSFTVLGFVVELLDITCLILLHILANEKADTSVITGTSSI